MTDEHPTPPEPTDASALPFVVTSVNGVLRNKGPMLVWGVLIIASTIVGFATALLGFVVILPVIGHASWHAYRETIDAAVWEQHDIC